MKRYDKKYCHPCMIDHWVETTNRHRDRCNGPDYLPTDTATHYIRWNAGGIEVLKKRKNHNQPTLLLQGAS